MPWMNGENSKPAGASDPTAVEFELPVEGFTGTPEEIERQWFEQVYRGRGDSMLQLSWRAVLMGSVLGGILSLTNLYIGLKSGWALGVAITACILSYAIWTTFGRNAAGADYSEGLLLTTESTSHPAFSSEM